MKVVLAADHRGFKLKNALVDFLRDKGYAVADVGTYSSDPCDYPDVVFPACQAVREKKAERAVIICYTGIGSSIAANKVRGIRAALVYSIKSASLSRRHNNSNVLVLPSHLFKADYARRIVLRWLKTEFDGGRHLRRIRKIKGIEERENA